MLLHYYYYHYYITTSIHHFHHIMFVLAYVARFNCLCMHFHIVRDYTKTKAKTKQSVFLLYMKSDSQASKQGFESDRSANAKKYRDRKHGLKLHSTLNMSFDKSFEPKKNVASYTQKADERHLH